MKLKSMWQKSVGIEDNDNLQGSLRIPARKVNRQSKSMRKKLKKPILKKREKIIRGLEGRWVYKSPPEKVKLRLKGASNPWRSQTKKKDQRVSSALPSTNPPSIAVITGKTCKFPTGTKMLAKSPWRTNSRYPGATLDCGERGGHTMSR